MDVEVTKYSDEGKEVKNFEVPVLAILIPTVLFVMAMYIAYKNKSKFWGYVGYGLLASVVGTVISRTLITLKNKEFIEQKMNS